MVALTAGLLLRLGKRDAAWRVRLSFWEKNILLSMCVLAEGLNLWCARWRTFRWMLLGAVFAGCLVTACVMDLAEHMIYRYVWLVCGIAVVSYVAAGYAMTNEVLLSWILFAALQELLFARMYGRADCHAFCCCGAMWMLEGGGFTMCVEHMAISFGLLVAVQLGRRNVTRTGKLRQAVPMLPYITAGFWICRLLANRSV